MFVHNINPIFLKIGALEIRWYGLIFALGFLLVLWMSVKIAEKKRKKGITKDVVIDAILWTIIGLIIGLRTIYVLVYNPGYYLQNPLEIFAIWRGGIAFHGGLIGGVIGLLLFCRKNKINFYDLADIIVVSLPLAFVFGRIANFINGELAGRVTDVPWAFDFGDGLARHPSQLYESFKNLILFFIMLSVNKVKNLKKGVLFWLFILLYGLFRFIVEFFRQPDPQLGFIVFGLSMGQLFCLGMIAAAGCWFTITKT